MAIREYIYAKTGETRFEVYVNLRSSLFPDVRVQKYKKCKTKATAERMEKILIRSATEDLTREEQRGSHWSVLVQKWETEARRLKRNPATLKVMSELAINNMVGTLKLWTNEWFDRPCSELTIKDGKDLLLEAVDEELSSASVKKIKTGINMVFRFGVQEGLIKDIKTSPVHGVIFDASEDDGIKEILSAEEVKKLLFEGRVRNHSWYPIWAVAIMTGMRSSELYALRKENVLLEEGIIRITESWDWQKGCAKGTKAGYWRNAPIASALRPIIEELMQSDPESPFLFQRTIEWKNHEQARILRAFCKEIGIRSVRFHTLRACFATHLLAMGVDQATIMAIGGWSNFKTFKIYIRLSGITERSKTDELGRLFVPNEKLVCEHISKAFDPPRVA